MKACISKILAAAFLFMLGFTGVSEAQTMKNGLDAKQQSMVAIAAFSGVGDLDDLKTVLGEGLDAGLSINEIKEVLVQVYAYAGFPRSLNAIAIFQSVLDERKARGIDDVEGKAASPMPTDRTNLAYGAENQTRLFGQPISGGIYEFVPVIDQFLKAHLFGDIFQRDTLDWKHRQLTTIGILSGVSGVNPQLQGHLATGLRQGLTVEQLRAAAAIVGDCLGKQYEENMNQLIDNVVKKQDEQHNIRQ
jgi:alkylhydroperoxidase/carboxymuconolactone decarboxylase family protein YurZ